jgi:hypothetical protein
VEDGEEAELRTEELRVGRRLEERLRGGTEEDRVDDLLVAQGELGDLGRQGEDDVEVGNGEELVGPLLQPLGALVAET